MRRRFSLAVALGTVALAVVSGCGSTTSADRAAAPPKNAQSASPSDWVSIQDCDAVEALIASAEAGGLPNARTTLVGLHLGGQSKIRLTEDGMWAWLGGGPEGTAPCPKR